MDNLHLKHINDPTNYYKIILHFRIWNALEESKTEKLINDYEASELLKFPSIEVENCNRMCETLLDKKDELREKILSYKQINKSLFLTKNKNHGK